jgi:hypothetical protein
MDCVSLLLVAVLVLPMPILAFLGQPLSSKALSGHSRAHGVLLSPVFRVLVAVDYAVLMAVVYVVGFRACWPVEPGPSRWGVVRSHVRAVG